MNGDVKKIGVLTSGGDAPGMNAAVRAVTRAAIKKGYKVCGILRGFNGLITDGENSVRELSVRDVSNILQKGGTMLYTARCEEFRVWEGVLKGKERCDGLGLSGLVIIGGDGSFRGAKDLSMAGVPCICIPGTIDNDISCTDYTIGYDTAMNTAMEMVDKIRDTAQSHDRCSVVEVMGRNAGWIALNVGIAVGAMHIITKEVPHDLNNIIDKIRKFKETGKQHFIIVVSEGVGNSEGIAQAIKAITKIETKVTILGHVQRGGSPTVRDRVTATQMGHYAVELLGTGARSRVVAVRGGEIVDFDIDEALKMQKPFDIDLYGIANEISF